MAEEVRNSRRQLLLGGISACMVLPFSNALAGTPKAGIDYDIISRPLPSPGGKIVELTQFFAYSCPYCFAVEPYFVDWVKRRKDFVSLKRQHIDIHNLITHQKLYFALESMGESEKFSSQVFEAYHKDRNRLANDAEVVRFVEKLGINPTQFSAAYNSFTMHTKLARVKQLQAAYDVYSVPTMVVDGRYVTSVEMATQSKAGAPLEDKLETFGQVLDFLVEKILNERGVKYVKPT